MNVLFVHQNFPGQYRHFAPALAAAGHRVVALGQRPQAALPGVNYLPYGLGPAEKERVSGPAAEFNGKLRVGQATARSALQLKAKGFTPDLIYAHPGWGEALFLKDVWPEAKLVCFWEFYYRFHGADVNFDPEFMDERPEQAVRLRVKNAANLLSLEAADWGVSPTLWQKRQFPDWAQARMSVIHDGIDTVLVRPDAEATFNLPGTDLVLRAGDEVITFVNRNLEPYRGYHAFLRALPQLLRERPNARVVIVGGEGTSYGARPPPGKTWKQIYLDEVGAGLDLARVHFTGQLPYAAYLRLLQVSAAHVYLTYPFVLSWSMLEAMSAGCLVIASRTEPVTEVLRHGENGLLFDFFDTGQLAGTVAQALAQPQAHEALRARARQDIVAGYDLRTVCLPQHLALARELASAAGPASACPTNSNRP